MAAAATAAEVAASGAQEKLLAEAAQHRSDAQSAALAALAADATMEREAYHHARERVKELERSEAELRQLLADKCDVLEKAQRLVESQHLYQQNAEPSRFNHEVREVRETSGVLGDLERLKEEIQWHRGARDTAVGQVDQVIAALRMAETQRSVLASEMQGQVGSLEKSLQDAKSRFTILHTNYDQLQAMVVAKDGDLGVLRNQNAELQTILDSAKKEVQVSKGIGTTYPPCEFLTRPSCLVVVNLRLWLHDSWRRTASRSSCYEAWKASFPDPGHTSLKLLLWSRQPRGSWRKPTRDFVKRLRQETRPRPSLNIWRPTSMLSHFMKSVTLLSSRAKVHQRPRHLLMGNQFQVCCKCLERNHFRSSRARIHWLWQYPIYRRPPW